MVKFLSIDECADFLHEKNKKLGINFGLQRINNALKKLNHPEKKYKTIHIAGTNGKGSTTMMISSILWHSNFKVGTYISPKIHSYNEMFLINGKKISNDDFIKNFNEIVFACEDLTAFEMLTVLAFNFFKNENVDYAIIEVGCGGLTDATNVITPEATILTNISYDHQNFFSDLVKQKLGIIKKNIPLITGVQDGKILEKIYKQLPRKKIFIYNKDFFSQQKKYSLTQQELFYSEDQLSFDFSLSLLGDFQIINSALAIKTCHEILKDKLDIKKVREGLENVYIPYRFEKIFVHGKNFILDGAHNLDGIKNLKMSLEKYFGTKEKTVIIGILKDKDYKNMLDILINNDDDIIIVEPISHRACKKKKLFDIIDCRKKIVEQSYETAINESLKTKNELVIITGTLYNDDIPRRYLKKIIS